MLKSNRRETVIFLLGGLAALGGVKVTSGQQSSLPKDCEWLQFPYRPYDLVPFLQREKSIGELGADGRISSFDLDRSAVAESLRLSLRDSR